MGDYAIILKAVQGTTRYSRGKLFELVSKELLNPEDFGKHLETLLKEDAIFFADGFYGECKRRK